jgi:uncharacterized protein (DUF58 family)
MSVTRRTALIAAILSPLALLFPAGVWLIATAVLLALTIFDALLVRTPPSGTRSIGVVARGISTPMTVSVQTVAHASWVEIRQPLPPEVTTIGPSTVVAHSSILTKAVLSKVDSLHQKIVPLTRTSEGQEATVVFDIVVARRGRHVLAPVAVRCTGPLGLGRWQHVLGERLPLQVFADVHLARRMARAVRQGLIRSSGQTQRGPLGLGTDFESVREYRADDDVRQINWRSTAQLGKAMSNNLRVEQDRDLIVLIDTGRLSGAPFESATDDWGSGPTSRSGVEGSRFSRVDEDDDLNATRRHRRVALPSWQTATRLDIALDTVAALGLVADEVGDRCGILAYDIDIQREMTAKRRGGVTILSSTYDLVTSYHDSDHERAFQKVSAGRRSMIMVLTDLVDRAAAEPLVGALTLLTRRHDVYVVSPIDPILVPPAPTVESYDGSAIGSVAGSRETGGGANATERLDPAVVASMIEAREKVVADIRATGAEVISARPEQLVAEAVRNYVRARVRPRQKTSAQ